MTISIIIPNYNHASFLKQRIDSVLNQSYREFEVIILDDCSTDHSRKIIEQYRNHPNVSSVVFNDKNSGSPFRQWQKGIALAKGEWIWIAESDDYAHEDLLKHLVAGTKAREDTVLSYCQSVEVDEKNNVLKTMLWWVNDLAPGRWRANYSNDGADEIDNYLLYKNTIPNASAVLFRKAACREVNEVYTGMKMCGDWLFWIQILKAGGIAYTAQPLNFFRQHAATTRVIDTQERLRERLQEEYVILQYIEQNIAGVRPLNIRKRRQQLVRMYRESYTRNQIISFICLPFLYRGRLPLRWLLADYFRIKVSSLFAKQAAKKSTIEAQG